LVIGDAKTGATYCRNDGSDKAAPAAEDGSNTNQKLSKGKNYSNDICRVHPPCDLVVGIESFLHIVREELIASLTAELPDLDRVEPEVGFAGRAECDCLLALIVLVALAVVPETNSIEVLQLSALCGVLERFQKVVVNVDVVEGIYYIWFVDEVTCVRLSRTLDRVLRMTLRVVRSSGRGCGSLHTLKKYRSRWTFISLLS
jgi:hypothetical protein